MTLDADLAALLRGAVEAGRDEQAFVFLTVDENGYPNAALLSRAELDVSAEGAPLAVISSVRTKANLLRDGRAMLVAVHGLVAYYAKLLMVAHIEEGAMLGVKFQVIEQKRDSLGIRLSPMTFRASAALAEREHWDSSARLLRALDALAVEVTD